MSKFKPHDYFEPCEKTYISRQVFQDHVQDTYDKIRVLHTKTEQLHVVLEENELSRESAESVREVNESERISKDSERDSKIETVEERIEENERDLVNHKLYVEERIEENERDLDNHKLDYVDYLASELGEEHTIRSLPNGTKDEIRVSGGKAEHIKRNEQIKISDAMIISFEPGININRVRLSKPNNSIGYGNSVTQWATLEGYTEVFDFLTDNIGDDASFCLNNFINDIRIGLPLYIDTLQKAKDYLRGLEITYQLAEPILVPLPEQMTPNTMEIVRLSEQVNKLASAIISLGGTIV